MNAQPVIILGAGGHACVLIELLKSLRRTILGIVAPDKSLLMNYPDIPYLGGDEYIDHCSPADVKLVNGIGAISAQKNQVRHLIYQRFKAKGFGFDTLIHPSAVIASTVTVGEGTQLMARTVIQPNVIIGANTIINTGACIDHDCKLGDAVHVAPGAVLSGGVSVGDYAFIGVGAAVIQGITISSHAMVRAGRTVVKHVV